MGFDLSKAKKSQGEQAVRFLLRHLLPYLMVVALVCVGMDWGIRKYVIYRTPMHGASKINRAINGAGDEIPIFGSSRALGSYIPDSLAPNAYNYGINGISFEVIDLFLKYETDRKEAKGPIIINFDFDMFRGGIGHPNNYIPHVGRPEFRKLLQDRDKMKLWYRIPGIRFFNSYDSYIKDYINAKVGLTKVVNKGASLEKNVIPEETFKKLVEQRREQPEAWLPAPDKEADFKKAQTSLDQHTAKLTGYFEARPDRDFFLVVAPYHWSYYESFQGMAEAQVWLDKMDERPNVEVVQVDGRTWPDSLFVNTTHINLKGARRFTPEVRKAVFGE